MHSAVFYQLMKDVSTSFERPSDQETTTRYLGMPVIVDDRVGSSTVAGSTVYNTYILANGSIRAGSSGVSAAMEREETQGNGFGVEQLITRRIDIYHPGGFAYTGADNPTNAVLAQAASWNRVYERKNVGITCLQSNV